MEVRFLFKAALMEPSGNLDNGMRACFTIIPMALAVDGRLDTVTWARVAGQIDLVIEGVARTDPGVETLLAKSSVLSFPDCIAILQDLAGHASFHDLFDKPLQSLSFDFVKEGHTSSVWKAQAQLASGAQKTFAVNVARDALANADLSQSSEMLASLANQSPNLDVAEPKRVLNIPGRHGPVVVAVNRWIDGVEVHMLPDTIPDKAGLFLISDFETAPDRPGHVANAHGRCLTLEESQCAAQRINEIDEAFKDTRVVEACGGPPAVSVQEGDLIWTGSDLAIVALSPQPGASLAAGG